MANTNEELSRARNPNDNSTYIYIYIYVCIYIYTYLSHNKLIEELHTSDSDTVSSSFDFLITT